MQELDKVLHVWNFVRPQVKVLKRWEFWDLIFNFLDFVSAEMKSLQSGKALVTVESYQVVISQVQLLQLGHVFEGSKRLELIIFGFQHLQVSMALPPLVLLLKLIVRNVQVLQLWAFESGEVTELIAAEIQVLQLKERLFVSENTDVLNLILAQVDVNQIMQLLHG
mgnify:FL=1